MAETNPTGTDRNAVRRARYDNDADYRVKMQAQSRTFRRGRGEGVSALFDCRTSIPKLDEYGTSRRIIGPYLPGGQERVLTFTVVEMAAALHRTPKSLREWIEKGRWPAPIFETDEPRIGSGDFLTWSRSEVAAMLNAFGPHTAETAYFRDDHVATIERVRIALLAARTVAKATCRSKT